MLRCLPLLACQSICQKKQSCRSQCRLLLQMAIIAIILVTSHPNIPWCTKENKKKISVSFCAIMHIKKWMHKAGLLTSSFYNTFFFTAKSNNKIIQSCKLSEKYLHEIYYKHLMLEQCPGCWHSAIPPIQAPKFISSLYGDQPFFQFIHQKNIPSLSASFSLNSIFLSLRNSQAW